MMHVTTELSAYIDEALAEEDRRRVQEHLSVCSSCKAELEELRSVSRLIAGLPREPLPIGFFERLERRRRVDADADGRLLPLPFPARAVAFALSSLLLAFVVYDRARRAFPVAPSVQTRLSAAASDLSLPEPKVVQGPKTAWLRGLNAPVVTRVAQAEAEGDAPSKPLAPAAGNPIPSDKATAAAARGSATQTKKESAATNEELHAKLDEEQKRLGIRKIIPPQPKRFAMGQLSGLGGGGGGAAAGYDEMLAGADKQPAAVAGPTPSLLACAPQSPPLPREKGAPASAGFGQVARSAEEQAAIWKERELRAAPPSVNYARSMLAVAFGPDPGWAVEIAHVRLFPDKIVVYYRLSPLPDEVAAQRSTLPYQYRVIPRYDLPVEFKPLP